MSAAAPVLVVQHEDEAPPAWLGDWLTDAGLRLDVRRPYAGEPLPESLRGYAGLVVLGGAMGAYDDAEHPWLTPTKALLAEAVDSDLPALGVCLGHQLAAVALGGSVATHPAGRQAGLLAVRWTPAAEEDPLFRGMASDAHGLQWNNDIVTEPPPGAGLIAGEPDGGPQVLRFGPVAWGVQFHPEVGAEVFRSWVRSTERDAEPWDPDAQQVLKILTEAEPQLQRTWRPMADRFARLVRSG